MTVTLTEADWELAMPVVNLLEQYDLVQRQKIMELVVVNHAVRCGTRREARFVADSFHKHVVQMLDQGMDYKERMQGK